MEAGGAEVRGGERPARPGVSPERGPLLPSAVAAAAALDGWGGPGRGGGLLGSHTREV